MPKVNRRFFRKKKPQEDYDEIYALIPNKCQGTIISAKKSKFILQLALLIFIIFAKGNYFRNRMLICKYIRILIFNSTDLVNKIRKGKKIWLKINKPWTKGRASFYHFILQIGSSCKMFILNYLFIL